MPGASLAFQINFTQELKEAILEVAEEVGEVEEIVVLLRGAVAATVIDGETASRCAKKGAPASDTEKSALPESCWFTFVLGPFLARGAGFDVVDERRELVGVARSGERRRACSRSRPSWRSAKPSRRP